MNIPETALYVYITGTLQEKMIIEKLYPGVQWGKIRNVVIAREMMEYVNQPTDFDVNIEIDGEVVTKHFTVVVTERTTDNLRKLD